MDKRIYYKYSKGTLANENIGGYDYEKWIKRNYKRRSERSYKRN